MKINNLTTLAASIAAALMLSACGDSETSTSPIEETPSSVSEPSNDTSSPAPAPSKLVATSVLVTDTESYTASHRQAFAETWVTISSVDITSEAGEVSNLFTSAEGLAININTLNDVGELLSVESLAAGSYVAISITTGAEVTLVDAEGESTTALLTADATPAIFDTEIDLTVTEDEPAIILVDFSGKHVQIDETTGLASIKLKAHSHGEENNLDRMRSRLGGSVASIEDASTFTINQYRSEEVLTVVLEAGATVTDYTTGESTADTSLLAVDAIVKIDGNYDPDTLTIAANTVVINPSKKSEDHKGGHDKDRDDRDHDYDDGMTHLSGTVSSFDGSELIINVTEADFTPPADALSIANVSGAHFPQGSMASLAEGQTVMIKGDWDEITFTANFIKIEGLSNEFAQLSKLTGTLVIAEDGSLSLTEAELEGELLAEPVQLDTSSAHIKNGFEECLEDGATIHAGGELDVDTGLFVVGVMSIAGGECGFEHRRKSRGDHDKGHGKPKGDKGDRDHDHDDTDEEGDEDDDDLEEDESDEEESDDSDEA